MTDMVYNIDMVDMVGMTLGGGDVMEYRVVARGMVILAWMDIAVTFTFLRQKTYQTTFEWGS